MAAASQSPVARESAESDAEIALQPADLGRFTLALHEQDAVELECGGVVQVLGTLERAEGLAP